MDNILQKGSKVNPVDDYRARSVSKIIFSLDDYGDLFSDFDPRYYSKKAISDDFLTELRRSVKSKRFEAVELKLVLEDAKRDKKDEAAIKKRLREHFVKHFLMEKADANKIKRTGAIFTAFGIAMIVVASYLYSFNLDSFWFEMLRVLLEPGGWFLGWTGLDFFLYRLGEITPDLNFYRAMVKSEIHFNSR